MKLFDEIVYELLFGGYQEFDLTICMDNYETPNSLYCKDINSVRF